MRFGMSVDRASWCSFKGLHIALSPFKKKKSINQSYPIGRTKVAGCGVLKTTMILCSDFASSTTSRNVLLERTAILVEISTCPWHRSVKNWE